MASCTIYHNTRCSKSRQTLDLLNEQGVKPVVINYLDTPPEKEVLARLVDQMGLRPRDIVRRNEKVYRELEIGKLLDNDDALLDAMVTNPILIERPIVVVDGKVTIGRPPQRVLDIL